MYPATETRKQMKLLLLALLLSASLAHAEPLIQAQGSGVHVVLYSEPCAVASAPRNLPGRATWKDASGEFEGCWRINAFNIIVMYFDDKTSEAWPLAVFSRVHS